MDKKLELQLALARLFLLENQKPSVIIEDGQEELDKVLDSAGVAFAAKPPEITEIRFVEPTVLPPAYIDVPSGQERRRERRRREREQKKKSK